MRGVYRFFAFLIAAEVAIQAAAIALAVFGLTKWIEDGGTLSKATMEGDDSSITGVVGFMVHGINGTMLVPLIGLVFLIVSFFAQVPGGVTWAAVTFVTIVLQVVLGILAHEVYALGALHGLLALVLFGVAVSAGIRARGATATEPSRQAATV